MAGGLNSQTTINLAENGFINKVLFANLEPDDIDELYIELLAQKKALGKLCTAHMMGNKTQGRRTLQSPPQPSPTTPINHHQNVSFNLATLLEFAAGESTPDQLTRHGPGSGERVDKVPSTICCLNKKGNT